MWVVRRRDADLSEPRPALIYGYGGWNIAFMPVFYGALTALLDAGGVLVFANLRGGGELGWDGWQQGRLHEKQRTFDDLYAAAENLIAQGITASDRLAVAGASNGGLLAAAAVTQRPDLWRAVVVLVPLTDMLRYKRDYFAAPVRARSTAIRAIPPTRRCCAPTRRAQRARRHALSGHADRLRRRRHPLPALARAQARRGAAACRRRRPPGPLPRLAGRGAHGGGARQRRPNGGVARLRHEGDGAR